MPAQKLIETLDKMVRLHERLLQLAEKKTEVIKLNDMNGLDQLLKDEQKYVAAIQTMESQRKQQVMELTGRGDATLSDCIRQAPADERERLQELQRGLFQYVKELKEQNELNQQLVYQSLQFVNMSMGLLQPQPERATYSHPAKHRSQQPHKQSMFDSQV